MIPLKDLKLIRLICGSLSVLFKILMTVCNRASGSPDVTFDSSPKLTSVTQLVETSPVEMSLRLISSNATACKGFKAMVN